ncbi:pyrroline-5-carboxylate reductase [Bacillus sp. FJAT-42376]|uniref:pyrroline-5-carboxylate reductase n=1 Tax=Bacillus sp. FJAT-42376 TaxID=2014076 RepID=UPI000F4EB856|nr:pyrroline-5-carboxylate reductase [Bacillus sp. FJAT-42376]AZB43165.1 pyrroline-5-carboxylate reductase [Bacillus sp. FJAT-42376]
MNRLKVAFIGAGSMAEAMISGLIASGIADRKNIFVTNRSNVKRRTEIANKYGILSMKINELPFDEIDTFILAMKPKDAEKALQILKENIQANQVIISVLAGISNQYIESFLHNGQQIIRAMPNTSSMIGESATALAPGPAASMENVWLAEEIMSSIGKVFVLRENQMDLFTGIAGSGPAYFYYLMESIEKTAAENGMDPDLARRAGAQTILGAAKMIMSQEQTPAQLRKNVTSPNGTTAAGLEALKCNGGGHAIAQAILSAAERSKEMSEQFQEAMPVR